VLPYREEIILKKIIVEGHRGYCSKYPENTLISFEKALELVVDAIEFDVWLSKDKVPVIIHDGDVSRTTDGEGHVRDKTLEEIKRLDAGKWFGGEFSGQKIPTLREALELFEKNPKLILGVEIKEFTYETVDITIGLLKEYGCLERCFFYCFSSRIIKYLKQKYNVTTMGYPDFMMKEYEPGTYQYYDRIGIALKIMTPELCEHFSGMGFPIHLYCADNEENVIKCIEYGADVITANNPVPLIKVLNDRGMRL